MNSRQSKIFYKLSLIIIRKMVNPQLLNYIQGSLANNISLEQIRKNLSGAGWPDSMINEAVDSLNTIRNKPAKKQAPAGN